MNKTRPRAEAYQPPPRPRTPSVDVMNLTSEELLRELQTAAVPTLGFGRSVAVSAEIHRRLSEAERPDRAPPADSVEFATTDELRAFFRVSTGTAFRIVAQLGAVLIGPPPSPLQRVSIEAVKRFYGAETAFNLVLFIKARERSRASTLPARG